MGSAAFHPFLDGFWAEPLASHRPLASPQRRATSTYLLLGLRSLHLMPRDLDSWPIVEDDQIVDPLVKLQEGQTAYSASYHSIQDLLGN